MKRRFERHIEILCKSRDGNNRILWLLLALFLSFPAYSQPKIDSKTQNVASQIRRDAGSGERVQTLRLSSKLMAREMPYRVILPPDYLAKGKSATRFPVVYLLHGLTGHFDNWTEKTRLTEYSEKYNFIIVTPEGENGWYTDSANAPTDRYESYFVEELFPEIDKRFRTINDRSRRAIAGLSMGGYGAIKFGLKYPEKFVLVGSFSGALGATQLNERNTVGSIAKSLLSVFGDEASETRRANDIFRLVREMPAEKVKDLPFIYLDCGTEDFLAQNNRDFMQLLVEKRIKHEFRQLPGGHTWVYWDSQVQEFLRVSERFFAVAQAKASQ